MLHLVKLNLLEEAKSTFFSCDEKDCYRVVWLGQFGHLCQGKHVTCVKRGKTCQLCQARENMSLVSSAGKHVKCGKQA